MAACRRPITPDVKIWWPAAALGRDGFPAEPVDGPLAVCSNGTTTPLRADGSALHTLSWQRENAIKRPVFVGGERPMRWVLKSVAGAVAMMLSFTGSSFAQNAPIPPAISAALSTAITSGDSAAIAAFVAANPNSANAIIAAVGNNATLLAAVVTASAGNPATLAAVSGGIVATGNAALIAQVIVNTSANPLATNALGAAVANSGSIPLAVQVVQNVKSSNGALAGTVADVIVATAGAGTAMANAATNAATSTSTGQSNTGGAFTQNTTNNAAQNGSPSR